MVTQIHHGNRGVASFESEKFSQVALFLSDTPPAFSKPIAVASATATAGLPIYSVVGLNSSNQIVPAVSGTTQAIGFTGAAITAGTTKSPIYRGGHVNINALHWPASYDTDAKKLAAFDDAPTPTVILADQNPNDPTFA